MNDRRKSAYWRRTLPLAEYDIANLRAADLPKGKRFETLIDTRKEAVRSGTLLRNAGSQSDLFESLFRCRSPAPNCERTYCPRCARRYRQWLIAELLRIHSETSKKQRIVTILLAASQNIGELDPAPFRHSLRKRIDRAGLGNARMIGGFENVWRAADKSWVLHAHIYIIGGRSDELDSFLVSFADSRFDRPTKSVRIEDPIQQLSYLLKFTTYHRPNKQMGKRRSAAIPLNPKEHVALIKWMDQFNFSDMLFLYRVRREGPVLQFT